MDIKVKRKGRLTPPDEWFAHSKRTTHTDPRTGKQITVMRDSGGQFTSGGGRSTSDRNPEIDKKIDKYYEVFEEVYRMEREKDPNIRDDQRDKRHELHVELCKLGEDIKSTDYGREELNRRRNLRSRKATRARGG